MDEEKFTPDEQKAINKFSLLNSLFIFINGIVLYINNSKFVKTGAYNLYIATALMTASVIITIMALVLYFRKLKNITNYRNRYAVCNILYVILFVCHVFICKDYVIDIFSGEKTVITSEYNARYGYFYTEDNGEEIKINLTDEMAEILLNNELIDSEEIYNFDTGTYYYKKKAHITYYPNSKVLKDAFVEE